MPLSRDPSRKAALKRSETVLHRGKAILQVAYFGGQGQNTRAQQLEADFFVAHELVGRMTYRSLVSGCRRTRTLDKRAPGFVACQYVALTLLSDCLVKIGNHWGALSETSRGETPTDDTHRNPRGSGVDP